MITDFPAGKLEYIKPDEQAMKIVEQIISQHQQILEMNQKLFKYLAGTVQFVPLESSERPKGHGDFV